MAKKKETKRTNTIIKSENKENEFATRAPQSFEVQNMHIKQHDIENLIYVVLLCIDNTVYHFGASLKDLGKKWFSFNKMEMTAKELLETM